MKLMDILTQEVISEQNEMESLHQELNQLSHQEKLLRCKLEEVTYQTNWVLLRFDNPANQKNIL